MRAGHRGATDDVGSIRSTNPSSFNETAGSKDINTRSPVGKGGTSVSGVRTLRKVSSGHRWYKPSEVAPTQITSEALEGDEVQASTLELPAATTTTKPAFAALSTALFKAWEKEPPK